MAPKISLVMANYNYGAYIEEALRSVLGQNFEDYEVIVVDDGSTDASRQIIERLSKEFGGRLKTVFQENRGVAAARNAGLALSRGEYVGFLDSDDVLFENSMLELAAYLDAHPGIEMVYANAELFESWTGKRLGNWFGEGSGRKPCWGRFAGELLMGGNFIPIQTALVRRRAIDAAGSFDENFRVGEDWDLWLRISARYDGRYLDKTLSRIRRHPANISSGLPNAYSQIKVLRKALKLFPQMVDRVGVEALQERWDKVYYDLGRTLFLNGQTKRGRLFLRKAWCVDNIRHTKVVLYFMLSFAPFGSLVRRAWCFLTAALPKRRAAPSRPAQKRFGCSNE